jgi:hypothetical protein
MLKVIIIVFAFIGIYCFSFVAVTTCAYFDGKVTKPPWIWWREE